MTDAKRVALSALLGAIGGGLWGYLFLTQRGTRLRLELEPGLDDLIVEARRFRASIEKAREAASEGWQGIDELMHFEPPPEPDRDRVRSTAH